jgi:hypothetical protein
MLNMKRKDMKIVLGLIFTLFATISASADFVLAGADFARVRIVVADPVDDVRRFAASELQSHLRLITGREIAILEGGLDCKRCFLVGARAPDDTEPLLEEEARYHVTDKTVYLYGNDRIQVSGAQPWDAVVAGSAMRVNRVGTVFSVYLFLEQQLGVRWLEPGTEGIVAPPQRQLRLPLAANRWQSPFVYQRNMRSYAWRRAHEPAVYLPEAFEITQQQGQEKRDELDLWLRRMRMGARNHLNYGHAFHDWWAPRGKTHPEYFALNGSGVRGPIQLDQPDRVKMCVSNAAFVQQIVDDWLEDRKRAPLSYPALCVAQNDGGGGGAAEYCHCDVCQALDVRHEDEAFGKHLTDRYMHLANQALRTARRVVPDALVTAYAYSVTEAPPRREHLEDGIVLQFVTSMAASQAETAATYEGWRQMGAKEFMFRPNDLCIELGLPLGHAKRIWAHQKQAVGFGAKGTDHDSIYGLWTGISGLTYYVLARSHIEPERPFDYWVQEYAKAFGAARPEVEAYLAHWHRKFDDTILPANSNVRADGGRGFLRWNGMADVSSRIGTFYYESDFNITDSLLTRGLEQQLSAGERLRLERLKLGNQHNRLTFEAMEAVNRADTAAVRDKASALLAFRVEAREKLRMNWRTLFSTQHRMGDATGITSLLIEPRVAARRTFEAHKVVAPPVIDGRLEEPFWDGAQTAVGLADNSTAGPPKAGTQVYLAWDEEALYIGLACEEPRMEEVVETVVDRDGAVWTDNAVEIFIDGARTQRDFHQLILSSAGVLLDGHKTGGTFSTDWDLSDQDLSYGITRHKRGWRAELRLSWSGLEIAKPIPGTALRFNITRDRKISAPGHNESTALSPTFGGFHAPARFATLTLR